jgi:DNA/RNA endonuclease YhcR with UshA esterase domain
MKTKLSLKILYFLLSIFFLASSLCLANNKKITPGEASAHIGQTATVCGHVASTKYAYRLKGRPTFLNLDKPYPNQIFTVVIWGSDRSAFGTPEAAYSGKNICVTGIIKSYRGIPEIIAKRPSQITSSE